MESVYFEACQQVDMAQQGLIFYERTAHVVHITPDFECRPVFDFDTRQRTVALQRQLVNGLCGTDDTSLADSFDYDSFGSDGQCVFLVWPVDKIMAESSGDFINVLYGDWNTCSFPFSGQRSSTIIQIESECRRLTQVVYSQR